METKKNDERLRGEYMTLITRITEAEARGEDRGRAEGIAEGKAKAKAEMVWAMYKNDVDIFTICKCSELSDKEVLDIIRSHPEEVKDKLSEPVAGDRKI